MAGFLLARAGVDVAVLEKHADFHRDFRKAPLSDALLAVVSDPACTASANDWNGHSTRARSFTGSGLISAETGALFPA
jgi:2-polyprenyl-6-methoxyphenol hydroxylase-like FAD-dependent oxidoreductase